MAEPLRLREAMSVDAVAAYREERTFVRGSKQGRAEHEAVQVPPDIPVRAKSGAV